MNGNKKNNLNNHKKVKSKRNEAKKKNILRIKNMIFYNQRNEAKHERS